MIEECDDKSNLAFEKESSFVQDCESQLEACENHQIGAYSSYQSISLACCALHILCLSLLHVPTCTCFTDQYVGRLPVPMGMYFVAAVRFNGQP